MKKNYVLTGAAAIALCLMATSCSKSDDLYNPNQLKEDVQSSFEKNIMNGVQIDPNQTWNTSEATSLKVTTEVAGQLKIYTANPVGENAAALVSLNVNPGTCQLTVAKPSNAKTLYAALFDTDGSVRVMEMKDNTATFKAPRAASASRMTRSQVKYGNNFPDAPTNDYVLAVPAGVELARDYNDGEVNRAMTAENGNYIDASVKKVNIWGGWDGSKNSGGTLYVTGNVQLDYYYVAPNTTIYITQNSTLSIPAPGEVVAFNGVNGHCENLQAGCKYYLAPGAKLITNGHIKLNSTELYVASGAEVTAPSLESNGIGIIYNQGTATFTGDVSVKNADSYVINEGTLSAANYGDYGSGNFWNTGKVTISGTTTVNSNANVWINEGEYTTTDFTYNAGSINVWNLCKLTVTNMFDMTLGDSSTSTFAMDNGSSAIINNFHIQGPARINMAGNSIIKVSGTCNMDCRKADYGVFGPASGDDWAVFQANVISKGIDEQGYEVTYGGKLYVACDSHFANGYSGQYPYIDFVGDARIIEGQANAPVTIPANGKCSDGYNGGGETREDPVMYYYYAFEDLGSTDDLDFNDIVIRVSAPVDGTCDVQLCAAGGTLKTKVLYGEGENPQVLVADVRSLCGNLWNTGATTSISTFKNIGELNNITDASDLPFAIEVEREDGTLLSVSVKDNGIGVPPLMIKVSGIAEGDNAGKWFWPRERVKISEAYENFTKWANDRTTNQDWYKYYIDDQVTKY